MADQKGAKDASKQESSEYPETVGGGVASGTRLGDPGPMTKATLRRTYGYRGKYYGPGEDIEVPKAVADSYGEKKAFDLPMSDKRREAPKASGGPDAKEAQRRAEAARKPAGG
ncbi:MAG: hypothetical protein H0V43_07220 [Gemmatimonadales bacterium]|nr:hypothetical protein [Gemmatimonadales bacterium]